MQILPSTFGYKEKWQNKNNKNGHEGKDENDGTDEGEESDHESEGEEDTNDNCTAVTAGSVEEISVSCKEPVIGIFLRLLNYKGYIYEKEPLMRFNLKVS